MCVTSVAHIFYFGGVIMALIKCSNCENLVSDKAKICPHCQQQLIEDVAEESIPIICEDCGTELSETDETCPKCGCPVTKTEITIEADTPQKVEITSVNLSKHKKPVIIGVISTIIILVVGFGIAFGINYSKNLEYEKNYESAASSILAGATDAESACNLIKSVWYNTIYEISDTKTNQYTKDNYGRFHDDFNTSLKKLFSNTIFKVTILLIEENRTTVSEAMKKLQNPPEKHQEAYEAIKKLYDAYLDLTSLAIDPSGNLTSYSSNFNEADNEVLKCYNEVKLYIEE